MFYEGDRSVLEALAVKAELLRRGDSHKFIRPLLIIAGGVMGGVYGAGAVVALKEAGYSKVFDHVAGFSTGAAVGAYFLSGNPEVGATIYHEECCTTRFLGRRWKNPCDIGYLDSVFQGSTGKPMDTGRILSSRTAFYIAVTEYKSAQQDFLKPESHEDVHLALKASVAMPGMYNDPVVIDGVRYVDGSYGDPLPAERLIAGLDSTHVLVIANREKIQDDKTPFLERVMYDTLWRLRLSRNLRRVAKKRRERMAERFDWLLSQTHVPAAVVWGDGSVLRLERDSQKLKDCVEQSRKWWREILTSVA